MYKINNKYSLFAYRKEKLNKIVLLKNIKISLNYFYY